MLDKFLKIAGVKSEAEFLKKFPTEESFFKAFPKAKAEFGIGVDGDDPKKPIGLVDPTVRPDMTGTLPEVQVTAQGNSRPQMTPMQPLPVDIEMPDIQPIPQDQMPQVSFDQPEETQAAPKKKRSMPEFNMSLPKTNDIIMAALGGLNALYKGPKADDNQNNMRYNTNDQPYGTGSQAIYEHGGSVKGKKKKIAANGADIAPITPEERSKWEAMQGEAYKQGYLGNDHNRMPGVDFMKQHGVDPSRLSAYQADFQSLSQTDPNRIGYKDELSKVDDFYGHRTAQQRYRQFSYENQRYNKNTGQYETYFKKEAGTEPMTLNNWNQEAGITKAGQPVTNTASAQSIAQPLVAKTSKAHEVANTGFLTREEAMAKHTNMKAAGQTNPDNFYEKPKKKFGIFEEGGEVMQQGEEGLMVDDSGTAKKIGANMFTGDTFVFNGPSHDKGGIDISYNGANVEVEGNESAFIDRGGDLNVFGNLHIPGTKTKFKEAGKKIAKVENKTNKKLHKGTQLVNDKNPHMRNETLAFSTGEVLMDAAKIEQKQIANVKESLAELQSSMLDVANFFGIEPKKLPGQMKAKYGVKMDDGGDIMDLASNLAKNTFMDVKPLNEPSAITPSAISAPERMQPSGQSNSKPIKGKALKGDVQQRAIAAAQFLVQSGIEPHLAAGITGNLVQESSVNPAAVNPTSGAFGIGQWLGNRKKNLFKAAAQAGVHPTDFQFQLQYLINEPGESGKAFQAMSQASSPEEAAIIWANKYERMGKNEANYPKRTSSARQIYNHFSSKATMKEGGKVGKKEPIYVDSPNDPRYRAYQDSLTAHNSSALVEKSLAEWHSSNTKVDMDKYLKNRRFNNGHPFDLQPSSYGETSLAGPDDNVDFLMYYTKPAQPVVLGHPQQSTMSLPVSGTQPIVNEVNPEMQQVSTKGLLKPKSWEMKYQQGMQPVYFEDGGKVKADVGYNQKMTKKERERWEEEQQNKKNRVVVPTPEITPFNPTIPDVKLLPTPTPTMPTMPKEVKHKFKKEEKQKVGLKDNLGLGDFLPELMAMFDKPDQVPGLQYNPELFHPYNVTFQDRLNANNSTFRAMEQSNQYSPSVLGALAAQKYDVDNQVLGEEFRTNQGIENDIINKNKGIMNEAGMVNLNLKDQQLVRQAQAKSNTDRNKNSAAVSISDKVNENRQFNNNMGILENMYGYGLTDDNKLQRTGPNYQFTSSPVMGTNTGGDAAASYQMMTGDDGKKYKVKIDKDGNVSKEIFIDPDEKKKESVRAMKAFFGYKARG